MGVNRKIRRHSASEQSVLDAALAFARSNGFEGDSLPRGRRNSCDECPLARAAGPGACVTECFLGRWGEDGRLSSVSVMPGAVQLFARLFDAGRFPELEDRSPAPRLDGRLGGDGGYD